MGARFLEEVWYNNNIIILELSRVHIYLQPSAQRRTRHVDDLYRASCAHWQKSTWPAVLVGMVDGHGYMHGQLKDTIYDARGLCQTIQSTFKPVFS